MTQTIEEKLAIIPDNLKADKRFLQLYYDYPDDIRTIDENGNINCENCKNCHLCTDCKN